MRWAHRAQAALEFALAMPVLILLTFGVLDAGRAVVAAVSLDNAAIEGARYAALHVNDSTCAPPAAGTSTCQAEVIGLLSNVALGVDSAQLRSQTTLWLTPIPPPPPPPLLPPPLPPVTGPVTVVIAYKFTAMTPFINGIAGTFPITARSSMLAR